MKRGILQRSPRDHTPSQHHLPLPPPRQKQRRYVVATSQNMQQTLPQTLRQHMDQRQSARPRRHRKPTCYRRPENPHRRLGGRHHRRQKSEKRVIDLGRTHYPLHHHLQIKELKSRRHCPRPLQKSLSPNNRNPNTDFRLFSFQIFTDFTQIPP